MNRLDIATYISAGGTAFSVIGLILKYGIGTDIGITFIMLGILLAMVSYIFGGFITAIKMSFGIAKWGFIIAPIPFNFGFGWLTFIFAIMAFFFVPIIPVRKAYNKYC